MPITANNVEIPESVDSFSDASGTKLALVNLPSNTFPNGTRVRVLSVLDTAHLVRPTPAGFVVDPAGITSVPAKGPPGSSAASNGVWVRECIPDPSWASVAFVVNAVTGSDEAFGNAAAPLKTAAELARRLGTQVSATSPAFGAKADGVTDDGPAINLAINTLAAVNGGTVVLPAGRYGIGTSIQMKSNVKLRGAGTFATSLIPLVALGAGGKVIGVGDGVTACDHTLLIDLAVQGTYVTTHDGVVVNGANHCRMVRVDVLNCGRDGISITSTVAQPTTHIRMSHCQVEGCARDDLRAVYGGSYAVSLSFVEGTINGGNFAAAHAVYVGQTVELAMVNSWIQIVGDVAGVPRGHIYLEQGAILSGQNSNADSNLSTDTHVEVGGPPTTVVTYLRGYNHFDGVMRFNDASTASLTESPLFVSDKSRMVNPILVGNAYYQKTSGADLNSVAPAVSLAAADNTIPNRYLQLSGGSLRTPGTYQLPLLQGGSNGCVWIDANTQLRYRPDQQFPGADLVGFPLSLFVEAVPGSSAATGLKGQWSADASFLYYCYATNLWRRVAGAAF